MRRLALRVRVSAAAGILAVAASAVVSALAILNGPLPSPLPLFPRTTGGTSTSRRRRWTRPRRSYIAFVGTTGGSIPDFGGDASPGSVDIYGFPYVVVDGSVAKQAVQFQYGDESDGVNHTTETSYPFYPIPDRSA